MRLSARRVGWRWTHVRAAPRNAAIDRSWRIPDATPSANAITNNQLIPQSSAAKGPAYAWLWRGRLAALPSPQESSRGELIDLGIPAEPRIGMERKMNSYAQPTAY